MYSIIIPLYNKEKSIKDTVHSVLNQEYKDFELIIVNDGSTDNSLDIVKEFVDERIRIIDIPNGGVSNARNTGIRESKGDWIFLLDADDLILSNCLSILIKLSEKYPEATVLTGNMNYSTYPHQIFCTCKREMIIKNNMKSFFFYGIFPRTGNTLIKKEVFQEIGLFSTKISYYEDFEFDLRLFRTQLIAYTPEIIFTYVQNNLGLSVSRKPIESEFAYYAKINEGSFFEQLLILENVLTSYHTRKNNENKNNPDILFFRMKLKKTKLYMILALKIFRIIRQLQRKIIYELKDT